MAIRWNSSPLGLLWARVRDSLWFLPTVGAVMGTLLAFLALRLPDPELETQLARLWLFDGSAEGARTVLGTIAGSLITVTGTVFSVTVVALQLASSQFTPRVVGRFVADRVNQMVLAVFIGTFTYTLLVLRAIRSSGDDRDSFVPQLSVTFAILLLLVSIAALIVFINHAARSIQISVILDRESRRTERQIQRLFPASIGEPDDEALAEEHWPSDAPVLVLADSAGYLQAVDDTELMDLDTSDADPIVVEMRTGIGEFHFAGTVLAAVWPSSVSRKTIDMVRGTFLLGPERTPDQDVGFGLVELSDIGVRALSPSVNDPTTALHCAHRLAQILGMLATRRKPASVRRSKDGRIRFVARPIRFDEAVELAFNGIRRHAAGQPAVVTGLLQTWRDLASTVPTACVPPIAEQVHALVAAARKEITEPFDRAQLEEFAARALAAVGRGNG